MKTDRVLLVYPPLMDEQLEVCIPNGIMAIASKARQAGFDVRIILSFEDIAAKIKESLDWADIVCFSVMSPQVGHAYELTRMIKRLTPSKTIIWGGVHCTLYPEQTSSSKYIDYVFTGECEETFIDFLKTGSINIPGLWHKGKGSPAPAPAKELPVIDYSLIDMKVYFEKKGRRVLEYYTSRSCPYQCKFCINMRPEFRNLRKIPKSRVISELNYLIDTYQIKHVQFRDDYFLGNIEDAKEVLALLKEKGCTWLIDVRSDDFREGRLDDVFLDSIMKEEDRLTMGFESGSDSTLIYINKHNTVAQNRYAFNQLKKHNRRVEGTFMYCLPPETRLDVIATSKNVYEFMQYAKADCSASVFRPYPGNPIYDDCVKGGFKGPQTLEEWAKYDFLNGISFSIPWKKDKWFVEYVHFFQSFIFFERKHIPILSKVLRWRFAKTDTSKRAIDMWAIYQLKRSLYVVRRLKSLIKSVTTLRYKSLSIYR